MFSLLAYSALHLLATPRQRLHPPYSHDIKVPQFSAFIGKLWHLVYSPFATFILVDCLTHDPIDSTSLVSLPTYFPTSQEYPH